MFGTFETWTYQALNKFVDSKVLENWEEKGYARIWEEPRIRLFPMKTKKGTGTWSEA